MNPVYAQQVSESFGTHTSFEKAIHLTEPQVSQIFLETLRYFRSSDVAPTGENERHFYTFSAAKGEALNIQMLVPIIPGLENYAPTIAMYKVGEQKEFFRYIPVMFFEGFMATPQTRDNFFVRQSIQGVVAETGVWVVEVFDEGNCIVRGIPHGPSAKFVEKKCTPDFYDVIQGKYAIQFGTEGRESTLPNIQADIASFISNEVFFEKPLGMVFSAFGLGKLVEAEGDRNIDLDQIRILMLFLLAIIVIVLIAKRKSLMSRL